MTIWCATLPVAETERRARWPEASSRCGNDAQTLRSLKAFIVAPGGGLTQADVISHCKARLEDVMVPRQVEFRDDLPRNPVGRVLKYQLRDDGVTPTTWDREAAGVTFERR